MRRVAFTMAVCALAGAPAAAQERKPAPRPAAPAPRPAQLEEEVEVLEAEREVKKAHVKAAEIGVKSDKLGMDRLTKLAEGGSVGAEDIEQAKLAIEAAKVQLDAQQAELKVIEVRLKHARKRLEEAKGGGEKRPTDPERKPDEVRPTGMAHREPLRLDPPSANELKARLAKAQAETAAQIERLKRAQAEVRAAEDELAALTDPPAGAGATAEQIKAAQAKFTQTAKRLDEVDRDYRSAQTRADRLRRWLEQAEKERP